MLAFYVDGLVVLDQTHVKSLLINFALESFQFQEVLPPEPPPEKPKPGMKLEKKKEEKSKKGIIAHLGSHNTSRPLIDNRLSQPLILSRRTEVGVGGAQFQRRTVHP